MARKNKMSVLKRQRERKKAEKAALKREVRSKREPAPEGDPSSQIATRDDLDGYGVLTESGDGDEER